MLDEGNGRIVLFCDFDGVLNFFGDPERRNDRTHFRTEKSIPFEFMMDNGTYRTTTLNWSQELVDEVNRLTTTYPVDFVWHSFWRNIAFQDFSRILGLKSAGFVDWDKAKDDEFQTEKLPAMSLALEQRNYSAFIWVDDIAAMDWKVRPGYPKHIPSLVIEPVGRVGIKRSEFAAIEAFIKKTLKI